MRTLTPFEYLEPQTVEETGRLLLRMGHRARVLAGGVDLIPRLRNRGISPAPECLLNIQKIPDLDYIEKVAGGLRFGALMTLRSLELSPRLADFPVLRSAINQISSIQVKTMSTAAGNLCVATPASDIATVLLAMDAELTICGADYSRAIRITNFFTGPGQTALRPGEIVTGVLIPHPAPGTAGVFRKLVRTHADVAKVSAAVILTMSGETCEQARIALGAVAPTVIRSKKAEDLLAGQKLETKVISAAAAIAADEVRPITDIRSTARYRQEMVQALVRRALEEIINSR